MNKLLKTGVFCIFLLVINTQVVFSKKVITPPLPGTPPLSRSNASQKYSITFSKNIGKTLFRNIQGMVIDFKSEGKRKGEYVYHAVINENYSALFSLLNANDIFVDIQQMETAGIPICIQKKPVPIMVNCVPGDGSMQECAYSIDGMNSEEVVLDLTGNGEFWLFSDTWTEMNNQWYNADIKLFVNHAGEIIQPMTVIVNGISYYYSGGWFVSIDIPNTGPYMIHILSDGGPFKIKLSN